MRSARRNQPSSMMILRFAAAAAFAAWGSVAFADDAQVTDLLDRGVALRREHRNEEALALFEQAARLSPNPATLAQMALAEQALGRWADSARDFDAALAAGDDPWIAKNLDVLTGAQAVVAHHVGWIAVQAGAPDAELLLDGHPLPQGVEVRVAAGSAVLEARAPGRVPDIRRVEIEPTQHLRVSLSLPPLSPVVPAPVTSPPAVTYVPGPDAPPPPSSSSLPVIPIVLGAVGLAALATGTYFGIRTFSDKATRDSACPQEVCKPNDLTGQNADADARTSADISTTAFVAGGVLVAGAAVWWFLGRGDGHADHSKVDVTPVVGDRAAGLVLRGAL
jgi:hypothetical protein